MLELGQRQRADRAHFGHAPGVDHGHAVSLLKALIIASGAAEPPVIVRFR